MTLHLICKYLLLRLIAVLEKLLNNIVAKDIRHKLKAVGLDFAEDLVLLVAICGFQHVLDEPRTMLITTEFHNMVIDILLWQY